MDKDQEQYAHINPILGWVTVDQINMDKHLPVRQCSDHPKDGKVGW